jgi:hypothetical protein
MDTAIPAEERDVVRRLAGRVAEIAARPVHAETAALWQAGNDLKPVRPMVYVYQLPWRELPLFGDGGPSCQHPVTCEIEQRLAEIIFRWERLPADMVVEPFYAVPYVVQSTGVGMEEVKSEIPHDADGGVTAKHYDCQIKEPADIEKIRPPVLTYDADATVAKAAVVSGLIGDLLPGNRRTVEPQER